jgi:type I restriction enzyme, S subunit
MMAPYPNYAPSGLPWAPQIPEGWQVQRNGRLFSHRVETGYPDLPILEVSLRTGVRVRDMVNGKRKQVMSAKEKYKRAVNGDIAYNMMRMWQGAVGPAPTDGLVSPAYVVVRPHAGVNTAYFSYLFRTAAYMQEVNKFSRGIVADRNRLYWESFKQMPSVVPGIAEQDKIVAFLQAQDAQYARYMKAKRGVVDLLAEMRSARADQAIKSSGTQQIRLDRLLRLVSNPIRRIPNETYTPIGLKNRGRGIFQKPPCLGADLGDSIFFPVDEGDFVFSGQFAWEGAVAVAAEADRGCIASHRYPIAKCNPELLTPEYLYTFLLSGMGDLLLNHHSRGAAGRNRPLNPRTLLKEAIPVPPIHLQREVSALYREELLVRREIEKELALIRELRERQIADVVTGQIDVRAWQPSPEDLITEVDLTALGDDDDNDTTEEETDGDDGHD